MDKKLLPDKVAIYQLWNQRDGDFFAEAAAGAGYKNDFTVELSLVK